MKLFIINTGHGLSKEELAVRVNRMKGIADADTQISMECLENTDICIDSQLDVALAVPEIITKALDAEKRGYDAIGIYCTSDPGLKACREAVAIPVIGAGAASFAMAMLSGYRYSFITTSQSRRWEKTEFARECGIDPLRLASVRSIDCDIFGSKTPDKEEVKQKLIKAVKECRDLDNADVVILGCLSFAGMGREIQKEVSLPVIDPAYALIAAAEAIVKQKLSHSKLSYAYPPKRKRIWGEGMIEI